MTYNEVTIYHFSTGWNGVYHDSIRDVKNSLGAFTWRQIGSEVALPVNCTVINHISLDRNDNPIKTIALAIIDSFLERRDDLAALDIARQLLEKIALAEVVVEPFAPWEV